MEQLSGLDASFLYLESPKAPMHIGGVYVFACDKADFTFKRFRDHIVSRLHISSIFRRRLVEVPLNLGHPYWVEDPDFEIDYHLPHRTLPKPGGREELMKMAARIFARPLERERPLWELTFVDGLDGFQELRGTDQFHFALITKVHHAAIDGGSGAEMLGAILDMHPGERPPKKSVPWQPERVPSGMEMVFKSYTRTITKPLDFAKFMGETLVNGMSVVADGRLGKVDIPPMLFSAPHSRMNAPVSGRRSFDGKIFPLPRIKALKNAVEGATVNDIILALCAGGLRKYLLNKNELPEKPLVAMAPISVRTKAQKGAMGNQVSGMLVSLATHVEDPVERLIAIHKSAVGSKVYSRAVRSTKLMQFVPSETVAAAARMYTQMRLAQRHKPFFNLVITNVPGPQAPLYLSNAKMLANMGTAPILDGLGVILVVTSYAGTLSISITACRDLIPDPEFFTSCLEEAIAELEIAIADAGGKVSTGTVRDAQMETDEVPLAQTVKSLDQSLQKLERVLAKKAAAKGGQGGSGVDVSAAET